VGWPGQSKDCLKCGHRASNPSLHLAELIISRSERFAELPSAFAATEDAAVVLEVHPDQGAFFEH
jgi:hypothetical protein